MCPKNLRTRLRPVNVCCAIVASHFVARQGRTFRSAIAIAPGLNFDSFLSPGTNSRTKVLNERLTPENAKRRAGRMTAPARLNLPRHGLKKPEIAYLPTACAERRRSSRQPCFRAAVPIWDGNRGNSRGKPANPHTFLCTTRFQGNFLG